jgi:hypothetical protein
MLEQKSFVFAIAAKFVGKQIFQCTYYYYICTTKVKRPSCGNVMSNSKNLGSNPSILRCGDSVTLHKASDKLGAKISINAQNLKVECRTFCQILKIFSVNLASFFHVEFAIPIN